MTEKLVFLVILLIAALGCEKSERALMANPSPPPIETAPQDQRQVISVFDQRAHGRWTQGCLANDNTSTESVFDFNELGSGSQSEVTYANENCNDKIKTSKIRTFRYQILSSSLTWTQAGNSSSYNLKIQFEKSDEDEISSLTTLFNFEGHELTYKIISFSFFKEGKEIEKNGSETLIPLKRPQNNSTEKDH